MMFKDQPHIFDRFYKSRYSTGMVWNWLFSEAPAPFNFTLINGLRAGFVENSYSCVYPKP